MVVVYFHPAAQAPISLLELGLCARKPGKAIVFCPEGYWKRRNVQMVCEKFDIEMAGSIEGLRNAIVKRLRTDGVLCAPPSQRRPVARDSEEASSLVTEDRPMLI